MITDHFDADDPMDTSSFPDEPCPRLDELCEQAHDALELNMHALDQTRWRFVNLEIITKHRVAQPGLHGDLAGRILRATADADPVALESALLAVGNIVPTEAQLRQFCPGSVPSALTNVPPSNPLTWGGYFDWPPFRAWCDEYFECQRNIVMPSITWWTSLWLLAINPKTDRLWSTMEQVRQVQVLEMMLKFQFSYVLQQIGEDDGNNEALDVIEDLSSTLSEMINGHMRDNTVVQFRWDLFAALFNFVAHHRVPMSLEEMFSGGFAMRDDEDPIIDSHLAVVRLINLLGREEPHYERLLLRTSRRNGLQAIDPTWAHGMALKTFDAPLWATARAGFFGSSPLFLKKNLHDYLLLMMNRWSELDLSQVHKLVKLIRHLRACEFTALGKGIVPLGHQSRDECAHHWARGVLKTGYGTSATLNLNTLLDETDPASHRACWKPMAWKRKRAARVRLLMVWFGLMVEVQKQRRKREMLAPDGLWGKAFTDARQDLYHWNKGARKEAQLE